jgi:D-alanine--poly(phosphoribitol) ligase subunit 2
MESIERNEVLRIILETVKEVSRRDAANQEPLDEETRLTGRDGILDSLGLVNVIVGVEEQVNSRYGALFSLTDDRAMSQKRSPFTTVGRLADYIMTLSGAVEVR